MAVSPEPALLQLSIDNVTVAGVVSADVESLLEEGDTTADAETDRTRSWTIKDGKASLVLLEDATDAGQIDVQDDYDTPATSDYVLVRGQKIYIFSGYPRSIKETSGPAGHQRIFVILSVSGGVATTGDGDVINVNVTSQPGTTEADIGDIETAVGGSANAPATATPTGTKTCDTTKARLKAATLADTVSLTVKVRSMGDASYVGVGDTDAQEFRLESVGDSVDLDVDPYVVYVIDDHSSTAAEVEYIARVTT